MYSVRKTSSLRAVGEVQPMSHPQIELLFLTLDHVNNDGAEQRRNTGGKSGKSLAWWLRTHGWPTGIQVLCFNCNCGRSRNDGICPHVAGNQ